MISENPKKLASFVIGAGFSYSLANQKLTKDFSKDLKEKFKVFGKHYNFEHDVDRKFLDWLLEFEHKGSWNFELITDGIRHVSTLIEYGYPSLPSKILVEEVFNIIHSSLCAEYLEFKLEPYRANQFVKLIQNLIDRDYEIHIFDLNFDSVLEKVIKTSEISVNDFFSGIEGLPTKSFDCVGFSTPFNDKHSGSVNLYKLHGAFNIIHSHDRLELMKIGITIPINNSGARITTAEYGFRKVHIYDQKEIIELMKRDFNNAINGLSHMEAFDATHSLWTGNTYKLAMLGLGHKYPRFCYRRFSEIVVDSNTLFVIGYGGNDLDINRFLSKRLSFDHFSEGADMKTIVHSNDDDFNYKFGSTLEQNSYFEVYLEEIQQHLRSQD